MDKIAEILNARLRTMGQQIEITYKYKELKTDEDRIIYTFSIMREHNIVPKMTGKPKDAKESERLREQGNKIFVKCGTNSAQYMEALKLYIKSIAFAPYPSRQLALAYANRSAVLFELALYLECTQDINRALALDYPDNLRAKLCIRKAYCLHLLEDQSIEQMIKETEYWIEKVSLSEDKMKLQSKLDELYKVTRTKFTLMCSQYTSIESKLNKSKDKDLATIACYSNEISCASDAIAIKYNECYGRHVVATRDIRPGEVITIEKPYSLLLMQENTQTHCSNCLEVCWAMIPCKFCTYAMYCSEECRDIEWEKCHDVECAVFPALIEYTTFTSDLFSIRLAVLAVREAGSIQKLRSMLCEADKCDDFRTKGFSKDGKLHSDRYIALYSLVRNTEKRLVSDLFRRSLDSCFSLYILATCTTMFGAKLPEDLSILIDNRDVTFLGGLIMRHQQIISNNIHSFDEERNLDCAQYAHSRGMAAMPFCSLINHSCDPNILRVSRSKDIVLRALYPIQKGDQIFDNYGEHYALILKARRQEALLKKYFFNCNCIPCQQNWPLYYDLVSFKTLVKNEVDKDKISRTLKNFNTYIELTTKGDVMDKPYIIIDLLTMIQVLYDCAPMPCEEMNNVVETLKYAYDLSGNRCVTPKYSPYIRNK